MLTIPRREEIEAAVPELMDRAVYLFSVDEKPYFLVSVPEKEAEEILAKLKEGVGQMPVSDKIIWKLEATGWKGRKEHGQLAMHDPSPTSMRWSQYHLRQSTALQLWRWNRAVGCGLRGKDWDSKNKLDAHVCPVWDRDGISGSHRVASRTEQTLYRCRVDHGTYWCCFDRWLSDQEAEETVRRSGGSRRRKLKISTISKINRGRLLMEQIVFEELDGDDRSGCRRMSFQAWYARGRSPDDAHISVGTEVVYFKRFGLEKVAGTPISN